MISCGSSWAARRRAWWTHSTTPRRVEHALARHAPCLSAHTAAPGKSGEHRRRRCRWFAAHHAPVGLACAPWSPPSPPVGGGADPLPRPPRPLCLPRPQVILMAGLQGTGKTTAAGKLALYLQKKGRKVGPGCRKANGPGCYWWYRWAAGGRAGGRAGGPGLQEAKGRRAEGRGVQVGLGVVVVGGRGGRAGR